MKFAHSLNYPHYRHFLRELTPSEYNEIIMCFEMDREEKDEQHGAAADAKMEAYMKRVIAEQEKQ